MGNRKGLTPKEGNGNELAEYCPECPESEPISAHHDTEGCIQCCKPVASWNQLRWLRSQLSTNITVHVLAWSELDIKADALHLHANELSHKFARPCNGANDANIVHVQVVGQSLGPQATACVENVLVIQKQN